MQIAPSQMQGTADMAPPDTRTGYDRQALLLIGVLMAIAVAVRATGLFHDLPFSYSGDEINFVKRAMALGAGDLNPHWFHKPAFLMYLLLACYGVFFSIGSLIGEFASIDAFAAYYLANNGPFILIGRLIVAGLGTGTVLIVYLMARKIYGTATAGFAAALAPAVLFPMIVAAQTVKADIPASFFVALSIYTYILTRKNPSYGPLILAAVFAGVAMGTKYYGIILLPTYMLAELFARRAKKISWSRVFSRWVVLCVVFVAAFFVASPYNFLDPTFGETLMRKFNEVLGNSATPLYDPDNKVTYVPGVSSLGGSILHFFEKLIQPNALGLPLLFLAGLGLLGMVFDKRRRWYAFVLGAPVAAFMAAAFVMATYHTNPRHLVAVYPLICVFTFAGAAMIVGTVTARPQWVLPGGLILVAAAAMPTLMRTLEHGFENTTTDSRSVAHAWIIDNLPRDQGILQDDYGPILLPNHAALDRSAARARLVPADDPVLKHHLRRIDLLRRFPAPEAFNIDELGHQWWLREEVTDAELVSSAKHRDAANPLTLRVPKTLDQYRRDGIRYVITNSRARDRYRETSILARGFPSFVRFYYQLSSQTPIKTFDPTEWGGKGPTVWIYDLSRAEWRPGATP